MELDDQVYKTVVAEVNPVFIPDSCPEKFVKHLEKKSGVTCKINRKKQKSVYNLEGTLLSIQKAASYLYSIRHEALEKDSSEDGSRVSVNGKSSRNYTVGSSRELKLLGSRKPKGNDEESGRFALDKTYQEKSLDLSSRRSQNLTDRSQRFDAEYSRSGSYQKQPTATGLSSVLHTHNGERHTGYEYALGSDRDYLVDYRDTKNTYSGSQKQPHMGSDANYETSALGKTTGYSTSTEFDLQSTGFESHLLTDRIVVGGTSKSRQDYGSSRHVDCQILNFSTPKTRHKICLYNGDLTKIRADAVVCSTNPYLSHNGGLAKDIARIGGAQLLEAANQYTTTHGVLSPAQVTHLNGGKLPSKYVIYTVGPIWKDFKNKTEFSNTLKNTFKNCFHYASKTLGITHIAMPLIGSGISGAPTDKCSEALFSALMEFDVTSNTRRPLNIDIVDRDVDSVVCLQKLFSEYNLNTSLGFGNDATHKIDEHLIGSDDCDAVKYTSPSDVERNFPVVKDFPTEITHKTEKENSRIDYAHDMHFRRSLSYESLHASPRHSGHDKTTAKLSFKIPKYCHQVSIYLGDLTRIKADAIVNAANSYLMHDGGVARAIVKVGGHQIEKESDKYIKNYGPLYPSKVIHTSGGNLPSTYVIHAVGPVWNEYVNEIECLNTLKETFMNCLHYASNTLKITKLAIPLISSGIFGVPLDKCVTALYKALMADAEYESNLDIHIVDNNPESVNILQIIFSGYLKSDNIHFTIKTENAPHLLQRPNSDFQRSNSDISDVPNIAESYSSTSMLNVEKTKKLSSREKENSSTLRRFFSNKKSKKDKENSDDIDTQKKRGGKQSEFRVKDNRKVSPTSGPMKALPSHNVDTETFIKELIEDHDKKGNPVSEFKDVHVRLENYLDKTRSSRSRSLSRLPNQQSKPQAVSGERQSRRDSSKTENKWLGKKRSKSYDRHQKQTDDRNVSTNFNQKQGQWSREDFSMQMSSSLVNINQKASGVTPQNQDYEGAAQRESDARKRRREKKTSNDITQDLSQTNDSISMPLSQMENIGVQISIGPSTLKKHTVDNFLIPLPPPVVGKCPVCLTNFQNQDCQDPVSLNNCGHSFCRQCIQHAFKTKPVCPICGVVYGCFVGNQPDGTMDIEIKPPPYSLPGYPDAGTIIIYYNIPPGIQNKSHPNPGRPYTGTSRTAYLPDTDEGRDICRLLKKAFDAKLIFTVGMSVTTGKSDTVTWNDVHHKTHRTGGPSHFGYPDDSYLKRVREELASKGIH